VPDEMATPSTAVRSAAVPADMTVTQGETREFRTRTSGTIACVVDDPADAHAAIGVARRLAERFDARMLLIGIADAMSGIDEGLTAVQAQEGAKRRLHRLAVRHDLGDEEQRVAAGDPAEAVARIAAEEAVDLIVVGARRGLRARTLRSLLAGDLAATAPCPVVVAPPRYGNGNGWTHPGGTR
jgi:nucleotide-binding universal stress UspA family protein